MAEELTYVMLKPRKVGKSIRQPGELVPEAASWSNRSAYINRGVISPIPVAGLSDDHRKVYEQWKSSREQSQQAVQPEGSGSPPATPEPSGTNLADIETMTISEIRDKVASGEWDAAEVWDVESEGKQRSTLLEWLEEQVGEG